MLPGYKAKFKPEFSSTAMDFKVTFKNLNYNPNLNNLVSDQVSDQVNISKQILELCVEPKTKREITIACRFKDIKYFTQNFIAPLM